jgi:hypothetical protein
LADLGAQQRNTVEARNSPKLAIQLPPVGSNPNGSVAIAGSTSGVSCFSKHRCQSSENQNLSLIGDVFDADLCVVFDAARIV